MLSVNVLTLLKPTIACWICSSNNAILFDALQVQKVNFYLSKNHYANLVVYSMQSMSFYSKSSSIVVVSINGKFVDCRFIVTNKIWTRTASDILLCVTCTLQSMLLFYLIKFIFCFFFLIVQVIHHKTFFSF